MKTATAIVALWAIVSSNAFAADTPPALVPGQWTVEQARAWHAAEPWLVGCNFLPSSAVNDVEMWQAETFDPATIERELRLARGLGMNTVRVFLNFVVWEADAAGLKQRFERFLAIADKLGIRVMPVLLDDCNFAGRVAAAGRQPDPVPGVHNSQWVSSPPLAMVTDKTAWLRLEQYVKGMIGAFAKDRRVVVWDLYNEPGNSSMGNRSQPLVEAAFAWAREANPSQPLTVGAWADFNTPFSRRTMELSDVVSFHGYDAPAGMEAKLKLCARLGRPVLCTEWLRRQEGNTFQALLPLFRDRKIGCYNWGLVAGRTQTYFPWGSPKGAPEPKVWQHDVFRRDGAPYDARETAVIRELTRAAAAATAPPAPHARRPQGYRYADLSKDCQRTYGGYGWIDGGGAFCEEGITVQGAPLVCSPDTMLVLNAATAEAGDLHFVAGDIRRTWANGTRTTALHVFSRHCRDSLVGGWGAYEPVFFRFQPGTMVEDIRRPGYTETFGATHQVGALSYSTLRAKESPLEVKQTWYVPARWCIVDSVEARNLTAEADEAAAIAVGMNLRTPVDLDRKMLDWYADFHSNGKAGVPMVPRLTDAEYQTLVEMVKFHIEYRPDQRCIVARSGWDLRAAKRSNYYVCLMLDAPVAGHVLAAEGNARQPQLFASDKKHPSQAILPAAVIGLRTESFRLEAGKARALKYAIAFGATAEEAIDNARRGLAVAPDEAIRNAEERWTRRLPAFATGNPMLNAMLRYAAVTEDVNWEPDGRAPGDLGGWGRPTRAELCGYKHYYDQTDMLVPLLDMPIYDPQRAKKALRYDVDPQTGRLRKLMIWRQQYDNMLYWPCGVYKLWRATGDDDFLREMYPPLDNTMRWLRQTRTEPDGLLRMLTMPYDMFTIGLGDDRTVTIKAQALAHDTFRMMSTMARHLGKAEDAAFYDRWRAEIKQAANRRLWQGKFYGMCSDFPQHFTVSGNSYAILSALCDAGQGRSICGEIGKLYTGTGFPELHPPVPAWVGTGPYAYQNGDMYVDQLALIARAANKSGDAGLLRRTFFEFTRIVQRWKCFPVTIHPWNADQRGGVNEIHSASALVACLVYGAAGIEEEDCLRFRPMLIPELGGRVEIRDLLFRGARFHVRLEGQGTRLLSLRIDGREAPGGAVPEEYYDGKDHVVTIRVGAQE